MLRKLLRLNIFAFFIPLSILLSAGACSIFDRGEAKAPEATEAKKDEPKDGLTTDAETEVPKVLKKRIWVLPFHEFASPPKELEGAVIGAPVRQALMKMIDSYKKSNFTTSAGGDVVGDDVPTLDLELHDAARLARASGVAGFIKGEVSDVRVAYGPTSAGIFKSQRVDLTMTVNFELYDAGSARRLAAGYETQTYSETRNDMVGKPARITEIDQRIEELSKKIAAKMVLKLAPFSERLGWSGRVLRADTTRIFINSGRRSGVQIGEILKVVENPSDINDPQNGQFVGQAPGRMKGTIKILQYFGQDGSVGILQSGGGILAGDRVELF